MGETDKSLTEVEINNIHCSLLTHWASHFTVEGFLVSYAWFPFCNPYWLLPNTFLSFTCFKKMFQNYLPHHLPRGCGEADQLIFLWILFLIHLEDRSYICFLLSSRAFPNHHDLSKNKWDICLVTILASFLSTHRCIPSGPTDLCVSSLFIYSLTWSSPTTGKPSFLQTFPVVSGTQNSCRRVLPVRPKQRRHWVSPPFPSPLPSDTLLHSAAGLHFPQSSFCCWGTSRNTVVRFHDSFPQISQCTSVARACCLGYTLESW